MDLSSVPSLSSCLVKREERRFDRDSEGSRVVIYLRRVGGRRKGRDERSTGLLDGGGRRLDDEDLGV